MTNKTFKEEWQKCFKIDCEPPIEVFKDFVRIFKNNYHSMEELDRAIELKERDAEIFREVKRVWLKEFL